MCKAVMDSWGVGDAECLNGVVLYLAVKSRDIYIFTGRGARGEPNNLSDQKLSNMIER